MAMAGTQWMKRGPGARSYASVASELRARLDSETETFAGNDRFRLHGMNGRQIHRLLARMTERGGQVARGETPTVFPDITVDMQDEGWHGVLNVNLHGTFYCTREALRLMIRHGIKGSIINTSSTAALSGEGAPHYAASKAALIGMVRSMARELGPRGIRINNVMPGAVETPILKNVTPEWKNQMIAGIPLGRIAEPEDIAAVVAFLASDEAAMITGADIVANGGSYFK